MVQELSLKKSLVEYNSGRKKNNSVLYGNEKGIHSILGTGEDGRRGKETNTSSIIWNTDKCFQFKIFIPSLEFALRLSVASMYIRIVSLLFLLVVGLNPEDRRTLIFLFFYSVDANKWMKKPYWWAYYQKTTVIVRYRELQERELTSQTESLPLSGFVWTNYRRFAERYCIYNFKQTCAHKKAGLMIRNNSVERMIIWSSIPTKEEATWGIFWCFFFSSVALIIIFYAHSYCV